MSQLTVDEAIALCDAFVDSLDADSPGSPAFIRMYDGTVPADANTAITTQEIMVTITLGATAFGAASAGGPGAQAAITGTPSGDTVKVTTATFARLYRGNGTVKAQLTVSTTGGGGELTFSTLTSSAIGQTFTINTFYWQQPTSV